MRVFSRIVVCASLALASLSACAQNEAEMCKEIGIHTIRLAVMDKMPANATTEKIEYEITQEQSRHLPGLVEQCVQKHWTQNREANQCYLQSKSMYELKKCDRLLQMGAAKR